MSNSKYAREVILYLRFLIYHQTSDKKGGLKCLNIEAYLYDADGDNQVLEFSESICQKLSDKQLLWVNFLERKLESIEKVISPLKFKNAPL